VSRGSLGTATLAGPLSGRALALYIALLLLSVGLQSSVATQLSFFGAQPDFLLTLALCIALFNDAAMGASAGFLSGLMTAAIAGPTMGTYLVTRTVAGWAVGALRKRFVRVGVFVTLAGVGLGSVITGVLYGLSNPRIGLLHWLSLTFVGAGLNMAVALPLALLARWKTIRS
jgi:rod shape-determining protein MreD